MLLFFCFSTSIVYSWSGCWRKHLARGRAHLARGRSYLEKWLTPPWNPRSFHARSPAQTNSSRHHSSSSSVVANSGTTVHRHLATSNCARWGSTTSRLATRCRAASGGPFCHALVYFVDSCALAVVLLRGASPHPGERLRRQCPSEGDLCRSAHWPSHHALILAVSRVHPGRRPYPGLERVLHPGDLVLHPRQRP